MTVYRQRQSTPSHIYNILNLNLAGINARILFKKNQQQESAGESPAATGRGAEGRIHGGERSHSGAHKVGSSGNNRISRHGHEGSAGPTELQKELNVGH